MLYVLKDKYYEEGVYPVYRTICGFISGSKAKNIEYILKNYLEKYDSEINAPNDYFTILRNNKDEIINKLSKVFNSKSEAIQFFNSLQTDNHIYEYPRDWKTEGPWFVAKELKEF